MILLLTNVLGNLLLLLHLKLLPLLIPRLVVPFLPEFTVILVNNIQVLWDNLLRHNWLLSMPMLLHLPLLPRRLDRRKFVNK